MRICHQTSTQLGWDQSLVEEEESAIFAEQQPQAFPRQKGLSQFKVFTRKKKVAGRVEFLRSVTMRSVFSAVHLTVASL